MWLLISSVITVIFMKCLHAVDLDWVGIQSVPSSYNSLSTQNVLRCGKLCERQGRCSAATFDYRERMCHLHIADPTVVETNKHNGRYVFKKYQDNSRNYELKFACDKDTQIAVPSVFNEKHSCFNIRVSLTAQYNPLYLGCYKDTTTRDLDGYFRKFTTNNTKAVCTSFCYQTGFKYGGLQNGKGCRCGNSYGKYGKLNEADCSKPCTGNVDEICGGWDVNSIYATGL